MDLYLYPPLVDLGWKEMKKMQNLYLYFAMKHFHFHFFVLALLPMAARQQAVLGLVVPGAGGCP